MNILIDTKNMMVIGSIAFVMGASLLYLGFSIGKSTRLPEDFQQVVKQIEPKKNDELNENNFSVFKLKSSPSGTSAEKPPSDKSIINKIDKVSKELENERIKNKQIAANEPAKESVLPGQASPAPKNVAGKTYTIQIIAVSDIKRADEYVKFLREKNFDSYIQTIADQNNTPIHRVRVGQFSYENAEKKLEQLKPVLEGITPTILEIKP